MKFPFIAVFMALSACSPRVYWRSEKSKDNTLNEVISNMGNQRADSLIIVKNKCVGCAISLKPDTSHWARLPYYMFYIKHDNTYLKTVDSYHQYRKIQLPNDTMVVHVLSKIKTIANDTLIWTGTVSDTLITEDGIAVVSTLPPRHFSFTEVTMILNRDSLNYRLYDYDMSKYYNAQGYLHNLETDKYKLINSLIKSVQNVKLKKETTNPNTR